METFRFDDIITLKYSTCKKCLAIIYSVPCEINKVFPKYFDSFGNVLYPLSQTNLVKIKTPDKYEIETRLGSTFIKFKLPENLKSNNLDQKSRKIEFEECLTKWIEKTVKIKIVKG